MLLAAMLATAMACNGGDDVVETEKAPVATIAFVSDRDGNFEIYVVNADGTGLTNLTNHPADDGGGGFNVEHPNFAWSPDGRQIVFISDRDGNPEIYVMAADGTGQTRLTMSPDANESQITWSPDGMRIAFVSTVREPPEFEQSIQVMRVDGTETYSVETGSGYVRYPAWSPDGTRIAFVSDDIDVVDADGSKPVNLTATDEIGAGN